MIVELPRLVRPGYWFACLPRLERCARDPLATENVTGRSGRRALHRQWSSEESYDRFRVPNAAREYRATCNV